MTVVSLKLFYWLSVINIIDVLVSSFCFIWIPVLWVYAHWKYFNSFSVGTVFIRQNLPSTDVGFWCIKTIPTMLKEILLINDRTEWINSTVNIDRITRKTSRKHPEFLSLGGRFQLKKQLSSAKLLDWWVNVAFYTIMAISRRKKPDVGTMPYSYGMISRVLYSAQYHRQDFILQAIEQFGAL